MISKLNIAAVFIIAVILIAIPVYAEDTSVWGFDAETGYITGYNGTESEITVPSEIDGVKVIGIGMAAFKAPPYYKNNTQTVKSITLSEGITRIEIGAFSGSYIKDFEGVHIVRNILETVNLPDSITYIGEGAFKYCNVSSINLSENITRIEDYTFYSSELCEVNIPTQTEYIGEGAFAYSHVADIELPDTIDYIGDSAFAYCRARYMKLPKSLNYLGEGAFKGSGIKEVTIPEGITEIKKNTFNNCKGLKKVIIPEGVEVICGLAETQYYNKSSRYYHYKKVYTGAFGGCTSLESVSLPDSLTKISEYAFKDCSMLTSIRIPDSVTEMDAGCFEGCSNLTDVKLPAGIEEITDAVFQNCTSLVSIDIPDSVKIIGGDVWFPNGANYSETVPVPRGAFYNCTSLESITISKNVEYISGIAFAKCDNLKFKIDAGNTKYTVEDDILFADDKSTLVWFPPKRTGEYIIPNGVTKIEKGAFFECDTLNSIIIPHGVKMLGKCAFFKCSGLDGFIIPLSVEDVGMLCIYSSKNKILCIGSEEQMSSVGGTVASTYTNYTIEAWAEYDAEREKSYRIQGIAAAEQGDKFDVKVDVMKLYQLDETDILMVGGYDENGVLIDLKMIDISLPVVDVQSINVSIDKNGVSEIKAFILDNTDNLLPLSCGYETEV